MSATTLSDRTVIRLSGEGVRDFLQGLVTNDVSLLAPGRPVWAGLLTAQGKALFDFILWADGEDVLIDCEAARADDLVKRLTLYRLRRPIAIAREDGLAVHWLAESLSPFVSSEVETRPTAPTSLDFARDERNLGPAPDPRLPALGRRWIAPPGDPATGYHPRRIALGVPEGAAELGSDKTLWLETNAVELNGVSFTKGCYVGQENTARMHHRDKLRRRLLPVRLDGEPGEETDVRAGEKSAGELRNRAGDAAMAWLRLELADQPLSVGSARARVLWPDWLER